MALTFDELIIGFRNSRAFFFKHIADLNAEQWDWKPYSECKSIRQTLEHLVVDDRSAIASIETGVFPDFESIAATATNEAQGDINRQIALVKESHEALIALLTAKFADMPLDSEMSLWGSTGKVALMIPYLSSEDYYHAGQVGYIRMASDPGWDYYKAVYNFG